MSDNHSRGFRPPLTREYTDTQDMLALKGSWAGRKAARRQQGTILVIMMVVTAIVGFVLASYLQLVSNQNISVHRALHWNATLPIAEAGIEEALAHLHRNLTNRGTEGWILEAGLWRKDRTLGDGKYIVLVTQDISPVITSVGYMKNPNGVGYLPPRTVRVSGTNTLLWAKGMVAKGAIELNGNKLRVDSFDSMDPNASTSGQYDPAKAKDNGDVATNLSVTDSLNVWNAEIWGRASTGPGGTVKIGPNGAVGPKAWHGASKKGLSPGFAKDDMNVSFDDVKEPWTGGAFQVDEVDIPVGGTNYDYVLPGGNYETPVLNLNNKKMLITGPTKLYVRDDLTVSGLDGGIYIAPGGSLTLYVGGSDADFSGNGVMNGTGNAMNFQYFGLPTNTTVSMSGNSSFIGTIYAPSAALRLEGGGSTVTDFVGATITNTVKMNGNYSFHYDENLGNFGPWHRFVVTQWHEI